MTISLVQGAILAQGHDMPVYQLPPWASLVFLLNLIILIPVSIILGYTLESVYPVFAMVEDENPPAYQPVSLRDALDDELVRPGSKIAQLDSTRTVTSSLRAVNRLLMANGGVLANFRGLACAMAQSVLTSVLMVVFTAGLGGLFTPIATLLASLALVQLSTAWVHIVISRPTALPFWQRLPSFKRALEATWRPVALSWFANEVARWAPLVLIRLIGLPLPDTRSGDAQPGEFENQMHRLDAVFVAKAAAVALFALFLSIFLVIPANVVLVRVQASLLPPEIDTVIPFDRSFAGRVEPLVVGGPGFVSTSDAWSTFSKAAWRRLLTLYVKIFGVTVAALAVMFVLIVPEAMLIASHSVRRD